MMARRGVAFAGASDTFLMMLAEAVGADLLSATLFELTLKPLYRGVASYVVRGDNATNRAIRKAAKGLSQLPVDAACPPDVWSRFLTSLDVRTLLQDLFMFRLDPQDPSITEIGVAFVATWEAFAEREGVPATAVDIGAAFDLLADSAVTILDRAVRDDVLSAHEAQSVARHQIVEARLDVIERLARAAAQGPAPEAYRAFEAQVRREVTARASKIEPPNLLGRERVAIDRLFVVPRLARRTGLRGREEIEFSEFKRAITRRVVLGNPGAGKSTLGTRVCFDLGSDTHRRSGQTERPAPWFVELRRFSESDPLGAASFTDQFTAWARNSMQLDVPAGGFDWLLSRGRLLVVFDGLDELLDTSRRQDVRNAIESFCRRYVTTPVLVTSRLIGYDEAPLDEAVFDVVHLEDFDEPRIARYATNWFAIRRAEEPPADRERHVDQFLRDSAVAGELRTSPLLLGLLATLYRGPGSIPHNLPDVYDRCATLLFSTWDKERGIDVVLPFAEHIRPALRELAWWLFTTPKLASGVTHRQAVTRTAQYLGQRRFGNVDQARAAAEDFVTFCRGRAWVFTDRGTTAAGEDLFGFTHRTFLEFFAAEHLAYRKQSAEGLVEELAPRIVEQEWDVVGLIALQIKARSYPEGADDVMNALLKELRPYRDKRLVSGAGFVLRMFRSVIPGPRTTRRLGALLTLYAARGRYTREGRELLLALGQVGPEVRDEVSRGAVVGVVRLLRDKEPRRRRSGAELVFRLDDLGLRSEGSAIGGFWLSVAAETLRDHHEVVREAARADVAIGRDAWPDAISTAELLGYHGLAGVYYQGRAIGENGKPGPAPIGLILREAKATMLKGIGSQGQWSDLDVITDHLDRGAAPWLDVDSIGRLSAQAEAISALASQARHDHACDSQRARFALWAVSALAVEELLWLAEGGSTSIDTRIGDFVRELSGSRDAFFNRVGSSVVQRVRRSSRVSASAVVSLAVKDAQQRSRGGLVEEDIGSAHLLVAAEWGARELTLARFGTPVSADARAS
jgi:NACHT domain